MSNMVTIKDIAREAGVSFTTVSNVIHGNTKRVSPDTEKKVRNIMERLNYVPNMGARALASRQTDMIAFAYQSGFSLRDRIALSDPFLSELVGALEREIHNSGCDMLMSMLDSSGNLVEAARRWNVRGIVVTSATPEQAMRIVTTISTPVVFIDCPFDGGSLNNYVNVTIDDTKSAETITRFLIDNGHRSIGFISGAGWKSDGPDYRRRNGYHNALKAAGIPINPDIEYTIGITEPERSDGIDRIFREFTHFKKFTAIFVTADIVAAHIINYFSDRGVSIPAQLSVAGFDGNIFGTTVRPTLTTIRQNTAQKAIVAVQQLLAIINGESPETHNIFLPTELVVRDSVRKI